MSISEALLPEFDEEMANLRRTLERIPDHLFEYKPHPKSNTAKWMMNHLANLPGWTVMTLKNNGLDFSPDYKEEQGATTNEVLAIFDRNLSAARVAITETTDEEWMQNWTLSSSGREIFSMPRIACMRGMILNHMIHHRAQLTVYLRLNDLPVPALYGPSADEGNF